MKLRDNKPLSVKKKKSVMGTTLLPYSPVEPLGCVLFCLLIRIKVNSGMQHYYNSQGVWSTYQVLGIVVSKGFKSIISFSFRMVLDQECYLLADTGTAVPVAEVWK